MDPTTYAFQWQQFDTHLSSVLERSVETASYADVTLVSDEQLPFPAHKFILSACSPVLKDILLHNPHPHPLIYLRGVTKENLESILQFMYLGKVETKISHLPGILENARNLLMQDLCTTLVKMEMADSCDDLAEALALYDNVMMFISIFVIFGH